MTGTACISAWPKPQRSRGGRTAVARGQRGGVVDRAELRETNVVTMMQQLQGSGRQMIVDSRNRCTDVREHVMS
jgi:hypothetical protein